MFNVPPIEVPPDLPPDIWSRLLLIVPYFIFILVFFGVFFIFEKISEKIENRFRNFSDFLLHIIECFVFLPISIAAGYLVVYLIYGEIPSLVLYGGIFLQASMTICFGIYFLYELYDYIFRSNR